MELIHKWKHWQLFILMFAVPIIGNFIFLSAGISAAIENGDPSTVFEIFSFLPMIMLIPMVIMFAWQWSIGVGLQKYLPANVKLPVGRFKFFLIFPAVYIFFFVILIVFLFSSFQEAAMSNQPPEMEQLSTIMSYFVIIFLLHLFAMFCMFYCFYFCAKTYKSVLLQREATSSDYMGEFFLMWFNIIGVWIIQPKINELISRDNKDSELIDS